MAWMLLAKWLQQGRAQSAFGTEYVPIFWRAGRLQNPVAAWVPSWSGCVPTSSGSWWGTWVRRWLCLCLGPMSTWQVSLVHRVPSGKGTLTPPESLARSSGELRSFVPSWVELNDMPVVLVTKPVAERRRNEAAGSAEDTITPTARVILHARDGLAWKPNGELFFSPLNSPSAVGDRNISVYNFCSLEVVQIWIYGAQTPFWSFWPRALFPAQVEIF